MIDDSNSRPEINVVMWSELSEEDKVIYEQRIGNNPFSLTMHEFIITDKCLDKLPDLVRGFLSYHKANLELEEKLVLSFENSSLFKDCVDRSVEPSVAKIIIHERSEYPIQVKKQILSVLRNKAFW